MKKLVVVGNGMAGMACLEQILKYGPRFDVTVFGDETHLNYNRIMLSSVLAGERAADDIVLNSVEWYQRHDIDLHVGVRIVDVDPDARTVTGSDGSLTPYDVLLLATGSSAWMPRIDGLDKDGVFVFRTLDDTRALLERAGPGVKAVVIGGGLLGLEAARGLQVQGCDVTVVHLMPTLMERQLDPDGGYYLLGKMEELGINVLLGRTTTAVLGNGHVEGVALSDDTCLEADLVIVAAGIRPANASSIAASATASSLRSTSRARCSPRRSPATGGRPTKAQCRRRSSRLWASTSSRPATGVSRTRSRFASRIGRSVSTRS
jgi:nitrite reductase (NADH) large subunit